MKLYQTVFLTLIFMFSTAHANEALNIINQDELTEKQQKESETYVHQGLADKKVQELCSSQKDFKDICDEDKKGFSPDDNFGKLEEMLPLVAQALSALGATQSKMKATTLDDNNNPVLDKNGKEETTEEHDWCATIGTVAETVAPMLLKAQNDKTQETFDATKGEAKQAASFRALSQTHKDLANGSNKMFLVWTGVSGCYVAYAAQATFRGDTMLYVKMGFSVVMATFYKKKESAHKKRSKILENMAKQLPQAGECSPFDDRSCFCSEETSKTSDPKNFNEFCIPKELAARNQPGKDPGFCADKKGKVDKECKCKKNKTCIDRNLKIAAANLGIQPTLLRDPLATLRPISEGFGSGSLNGAANRNLNLARKTLKKFKPKGKISLNNKQKEVARALKKQGIPAAVAALAASKSKGGLGKTPSSGLAGFSSGRGLRPPRASKQLINAPRFKKGRSNSKRSSRKRFARFGKKRGSKKTKGVHIEEFAAKAQAAAEISNTPERGIFEIISNRYKMKTLQKSFE